MEFAIPLSNDMIMSGHGIRESCFILIFDSYVEESTGIEESAKWCAPLPRIVLFPVTMLSIIGIGLVRAHSGMADDPCAGYLGCALQVIITSDIIDAKTDPVPLSL
jgi:hypothetical protein